jgi:drug/metabolite transporter (DMT)-like permease
VRAAPIVFLVLWSSGFSFVALGLEDSEPVTFLAVRFAIVVALLGVGFVILHPPLPARRADWAHLATMGLLLQAAYFGLLYGAIALDVAAGTSALIVSLQPILVAVLAPWLADERVSRRRWAGLAAGLAGAAIVILARSDVEAASLAGFACAAGALAAITASTLYEKRFGAEHHPVTANLVQYAVGLAATLPVAWAVEDLRITWTTDLVLSLAYLVIANSLISITLLLAMIRRGEASRVSALFFLVPPLAALIAWAVLGETMPLLASAGVAVATAGVAVAARS